MDTAEDYAQRAEDLLESSRRYREAREWVEAELDLREAAVLGTLAQAAAVMDAEAHIRAVMQ